MPPVKRGEGRIPEVRSTPEVNEALRSLSALHKNLKVSAIIREAILEKYERDCGVPACYRLGHEWIARGNARECAECGADEENLKY